MRKLGVVLIVVAAVVLPVASGVSASAAPPASADPDETPARRAELRRMQERSNAWRKVCLGRLKKTWLPKLRQLPDARVELKTEQDRTAASIDLRVRENETERSIHLFWDPDECDAGAPNGGWMPTGFDWKSPQTPLEKLLAEAGNDCLKVMKG